MNPTTQENNPLQKKRLFGGEGWKPVDLQAVRQLCKGVKRDNYWDHFRIPSNGFFSLSPIPIQSHNRFEFAGIIRGTTLVVGYFGEVSGRHYWVTKCKCGGFELINEKTLKRKPHSPHHSCAQCRVNEAKRYQEECSDLASKHGLDFESLRQEYNSVPKERGKRHSFGLIHFIRRKIK